MRLINLNVGDTFSLGDPGIIFEVSQYESESYCLCKIIANDLFPSRVGKVTHIRKQAYVYNCSYEDEEL